MTELSEDALARFKGLVYDRCHLSFPESRETQFRRSISVRAEKRGHGSFEDYYRALMSDDREFEQLIALITTRETYFFRMPEQFEALSKAVLPELADREGKKAMNAISRGETYRMRLRAWSAGCATGQEAYSLSMRILDTIRYPKAWDLKVLGTDINAEAVELARAGRYDHMRLGNMPASFLKRYFTSCPSEELIVSDEVKTISEFRILNLKRLPDMDSLRNYFDIIFCRNVMIYFDLSAQQLLVTALADCLAPGGYLFTGEGEVLHLYRHPFEVHEREGCLCYKKPEKT